MTTADLDVWRAGRRLAAFRRRRYLVGGSMWVATHSVPVLGGLALKAVFDRVADGNVDARHVAPFLALFVAAEAARAATFLAAMLLWPAWWHAVLSLLRVNVLHDVLLGRRGPTERLPGSPGEAVGRLRDDAEDPVQFVDVWVDVAGGALFSAIALVIMLAIDWRVAIVVVLPMIAVVIGTQVLNHRLRRSHTATRRSGATVTAFVGECVGSALSLKVAGAEGAAVAKLRLLDSQRGDAAIRSRLITDLLDVYVQAAGEVSIGLVLLLAAPAMRTGSFTLGDLALFTTYAGALTALPRWTGRMLARRRHAGVALERLSSLLDDQSISGAVAYEPVYLTAPPPRRAPVRRDVPTFGELQCRHLTVAHPRSGRGIADVSIRLPAGSFTVVTGAVGSGKTTLLRGLLGLVAPTSGDVRWNGETVLDPRGVLVPPRCAYVAQSPRLLSESLRDNLMLGMDDDPERLARALRAGVLDLDVARFPQGTDTLVGPRGVRLSGGQLLRAALARALVQEPQLLVLDDVASALDIETEAALWPRLADPSRTCLVVSHRLAALRRADQIVVMDRGRVAASGSLAEVRDEPEFRRLWREEFLAETEDLLVADADGSNSLG